MHAEGFAGFNGLVGKDKAGEQACIVHVRRKFVDEFERTGADIPEHAIMRIADHYAVEKEARGKSPKEWVALRQEKAKPIFDELEAWLSAQLPKISGKTKLAEAIHYALSRIPKAVSTSTTDGWNLTTTFGINQALPVIGVTRSENEDEFDSIGLGKHRRFDEYFEKYWD